MKKIAKPETFLVSEIKAKKNKLMKRKAEKQKSIWNENKNKFQCRNFLRQRDLDAENAIEKKQGRKWKFICIKYQFQIYDLWFAELQI